MKLFAIGAMGSETRDLVCAESLNRLEIITKAMGVIKDTVELDNCIIYIVTFDNHQGETEYVIYEYETKPGYLFTFQE